MDKTLFYELETEYGPLYFYKKFSKDEERPVMREFFTQEEVIQGFDCMIFMENIKFQSVERNYEKAITKEYVKPLSPYQFLEKVGGYLTNEKKMNEKRKRVYDIFNAKLESRGNSNIITEAPTLSDDLKNDMADKVLSKYTDFKFKTNKGKEM